MTTTTARMTVRKGDLADMPKLLPGEFGLATDIQRLFIGQATVNGTCQVSNSDATTAKVEFTSANGDPIDLDLIADLDQYTYGITVNGGSVIPGQNIAFNNAVASFSHGLVDSNGDPRDPTTSDVFELYYNKEVGFHAEAFPNPVQSTTFTKTSPYGTADPVTLANPPRPVEFIFANKDKITIDYVLTTPTASRHGQLTIAVIDATKSSIKDEYDMIDGAMPLTFSLSASSDRFTLMFDTTDTSQHTFKYVQKSF